MSFMHLPTSTKEEATGWNFPLGIPGFRLADLNRVRRLMALDQVFLEELGRKDPDLAGRLRSLRESRGAVAGGGDLSETLIAAGKHLGPFIARLFHIEETAARLDQGALADRVVFEGDRKSVV